MYCEYEQRWRVLKCRGCDGFRAVFCLKSGAVFHIYFIFQGENFYRRRCFADRFMYIIVHYDTGVEGDYLPHETIFNIST